MIAKPIMMPPLWCVSQCVGATTIIFLNFIVAFGPDCTSSESSQTIVEATTIYAVLYFERISTS